MTFRFRPGLFVAVVVGVGILCALGAWQLQRKAWKDALVAQVESRENAPPMPFDEALSQAAGGAVMEYQPVVLDGVYAHGQSRFVFAAREGKAGVYVFTPFLRAGAPAVWVNRGFTPQNQIPSFAKGGRGPDCPTLSHGETAARGEAQPLQRGENCPPSGPVRVEGVLRAPHQPTALEALVRPKDQPADNLYFFRDPARFVDAPPAGPFYVESAGHESAARWPEAAPSRADFPNRHLEYALTWFGLAAALVGVFIAHSLKR